MWRRDPRFAEYLPKGDATVHDIATGGTPIDRRYLFNHIDGLRTAIQRQAALNLGEAVAQYVGLVSRQHGERLDVLLARTGLGSQQPITGREAGQRLGISPQRIQQLTDRLTANLAHARPPTGVWMPQTPQDAF